MSSTQQARGSSYFLSSVIAAFRQAPSAQPPTSLSAAAAAASKQHTNSAATAAAAAVTVASQSSPAARQAAAAAAVASNQSQRQTPTVTAQVSLHPTTRAATIPIPGGGRDRRRGSDSSSEGFREVNPAGGPWYIGGRTAQGEEKFFKLGVARRARSIDRLSLDKLSL